MRMRCRSRFQINVYWSRPVPNINAILPTEANTAIVLPVGRRKKWKWEGVNPLVLCTESYFSGYIYISLRQLLWPLPCLQFSFKKRFNYSDVTSVQNEIIIVQNY
jgi:hypothetical protein